METVTDITPKTPANMNAFRSIYEDVATKARSYRESPTWRDFLAAAFQRGTIAVIVYRFGRFARAVRVPVLRQLLALLYYALFYMVQMLFGISVQAYTNIGRRFVIQNFSCIFVLAESIGDDFTVCQGVTVGNIRGKPRLPIIGNNVYLEPGCKILGNVTIGDNVVVRANSLILNDIPSNSIAVGNPARVIPNS